jgi:hypothetical protein
MNDTQLIRLALLNHADLKRRAAKRRELAGPGNAPYRKTNRTEAKDAEALAARLTGTGPVFTRDEVSAAVNAGTDLVTGDSRIYVSDHTADLINLVVNAALTRLDNPTADLDTVITTNYDTRPAAVIAWANGDPAPDEDEDGPEGDQHEPEPEPELRKCRFCFDRISYVSSECAHNGGYWISATGDPGVAGLGFCTGTAAQHVPENTPED